MVACSLLHEKRNPVTLTGATSFPIARNVPSLLCHERFNESCLPEETPECSQDKTLQLFKLYKWREAKRFVRRFFLPNLRPGINLLAGRYAGSAAALPAALRYLLK